MGHGNKIAVLVIKWSAHIHHDLLCGHFPTCQGNVGHFLHLSQNVRIRTHPGHSKYRTEHKLAMKWITAAQASPTQNKGKRKGGRGQELG